MKWYVGPNILETLESIPNTPHLGEDFCMPIQMKLIDKQGNIHYTGRVQSGKIQAKDKVTIYPSKNPAIIEKIYSADKELSGSSIGMSPSLVLSAQNPLKRGDIISKGVQLEVGSKFTAKLFNISKKPIHSRKAFTIKFQQKSLDAQIENNIENINIQDNSMQQTEALEQHQIGYAQINLTEKMAYTSYKTNKGLGSFLLLDPATKESIACGMVQ